jgi:uncharacterized protein (DUF342 family)
MSDAAQASPVPKTATVTVQLSSDKMSASIIGFTAPEGEGGLLDLNALKDQIAAAGVVAKPDEAALLRVLDFIRIGRPMSQGVKVAEGSAPVNGEDGRVEMQVDMHVACGEISKNGRIDYHHRGFVKSAVEGELLARIIPPGTGTPGTDVLGLQVSAAAGQPATFTAGDNVRVDADGNVYSEASGMIQFVGGRLSVQEALLIDGDVDLATGDIEMTEGSVRIKGTVRTGFRVHAAGNVFVGQSIEDADIAAGGDVKVEQGIVNGRVCCNGAAVMKYGENATIESDGDVSVEISAYNCRITSKGKVKVTAGKGLIRGGTVRAELAIEANEIGSDAIAGTHVTVGTDGEALGSLLKEKADLEAQILQLTHKYGELNFNEGDRHFGDWETAVVVKTMKTEARLKRTNAQIETEKKRIRDASSAELRVRKIIHQGTIITIAGKTLTLPNDVLISRFFYDREADEIRWGPL